MGNTTATLCECQPSPYRYCRRARYLLSHQPPRKGGKSFLQWSVEVIQKLRVAKGLRDRVSYLQLGTPGLFFETFFKVLLPDNDGLKLGCESEVQADEVSVFVNAGDGTIGEAQKILTEYKAANPRDLGLKLVVLPASCGENSSTLIHHAGDFSDHVLITNRDVCNLGIMLGPLILMWEKSGFVAPRLFRPQDTTCILDLKARLPRNGHSLMLVAETCCHFNKYYNHTREMVIRQKDEASSHLFVWVLLKEVVRIKEYWSPGGAIDLYLERLLEYREDREPYRQFRGFGFIRSSQITEYFDKHALFLPLSEDQDQNLDPDVVELLKGFRIALDCRESWLRARRGRLWGSSDNPFQPWKIPAGFNPALPMGYSKSAENEG